MIHFVDLVPKMSKDAGGDAIILNKWQKRPRTWLQKQWMPM